MNCLTNGSRSGIASGSCASSPPGSAVLESALRGRVTSFKSLGALFCGRSRLSISGGSVCADGFLVGDRPRWTRDKRSQRCWRSTKSAAASSTDSTGLHGSRAPRRSPNIAASCGHRRRAMWSRSACGRYARSAWTRTLTNANLASISWVRASLPGTVPHQAPAPPTRAPAPARRTRAVPPRGWPGPAPRTRGGRRTPRRWRAPPRRRGPPPRGCPGEEALMAGWMNWATERPRISGEKWPLLAIRRSKVFRTHGCNL